MFNYIVYFVQEKCLGMLMSVRDKGEKSLGTRPCA